MSIRSSDSCTRRSCLGENTERRYNIDVTLYPRELIKLYLRELITRMIKTESEIDYLKKQISGFGQNFFNNFFLKISEPNTEKITFASFLDYLLFRGSHIPQIGLEILVELCLKKYQKKNAKNQKRVKNKKKSFITKNIFYKYLTGSGDTNDIFRKEIGQGGLDYAQKEAVVMNLIVKDIELFFELYNLSFGFVLEIGQISVREVWEELKFFDSRYLTRSDLKIFFEILEINQINFKQLEFFLAKVDFGFDNVVTIDEVEHLFDVLWSPRNHRRPKKLKSEVLSRRSTRNLRKTFDPNLESLGEVKSMAQSYGNSESFCTTKKSFYQVNDPFKKYYEEDEVLLLSEAKEVVNVYSKEIFDYKDFLAESRFCQNIDPMRLFLLIQNKRYPSLGNYLDFHDFFAFARILEIQFSSHFLEKIYALMDVNSQGRVSYGNFCEFFDLENHRNSEIFGQEFPTKFSQIKESPYYRSIKALFDKKIELEANLMELRMIMKQKQANYNKIFTMFTKDRYKQEISLEDFIRNAVRIPIPGHQAEQLFRRVAKNRYNSDHLYNPRVISLNQFLLEFS